MAKIMLVEDDNNLREIYGTRLQAEGFEVVSAGDGEEALAVAVRERPDLIIADIMMPKISGFDMVDILRTTPETRNTKIIMMTALSQAEDKQRAESLGADKYMVKSQVTLEDVVKNVHELLDTGNSSSSKTTSSNPPAIVAAAAPSNNAAESTTEAAPAIPTQPVSETAQATPNSPATETASSSFSSAARTDVDPSQVAL